MLTLVMLKIPTVGTKISNAREYIRSVKTDSCLFILFAYSSIGSLISRNSLCVLYTNPNMFHELKISSPSLWLIFSLTFWCCLMNRSTTFFPMHRSFMLCAILFKK